MARFTVDSADWPDVSDPTEPLLVTAVPPPRQRVFLPRNRGERWKGFLWAIVRATVFRWSPSGAMRWRNWLLRRFGATIDPTAEVHASVIVELPWHLSIGPRSKIAHKVILNCMGAVSIGADTRISQYAHVVAGTHEYTRPDMQILRKPVTIGDNVWIAADAFIGPGVTIADGAIVAARSSVFHDLPGRMVAAGEPATVRRRRDDRPAAE
ncbi:MAG: hypothetical protein U0575_08560 [Phycisphaerales bacterium]